MRHIIYGQGVEVNPEKISTIVNWPKPKNLKEIRGFLGLTGYYHRFVAGYAQKAQGLTVQLKKDAYAYATSWGTTTKAAFDLLT